MGRLTADPEVRTTKNDRTMCTWTIAVDRAFKSEDGPTTDFFDCVAFGATGDFVSKWFKKGKMIAVIGSIQFRFWEDDNGGKRKATDVVVDRVEFCGDSGNDSTETKSKKEKPASATPSPTDADEEDPF